MLPACSGGQGGDTTQAAAAKKTVTIESGDNRHVFKVEVARTSQEQARGLMFRTDIPQDGGMLFAPYPPDGSAPRVASFWMRDTPTSLDIIFIREDGTIANIAENTIPFTDAQHLSHGPIAAVLEILGGRSAELGINPGDKVSW